MGPCFRRDDTECVALFAVITSYSRDTRDDEHTVKVGFNYRFGWGG